MKKIKLGWQECRSKHLGVIAWITSTFIVYAFQPVAAARTFSDDIVDLHKEHWAYSSTKKLIDNYDVLQGFPDHTFRGENLVNRYEFSVIILNLINYLSDKKKMNIRASIKPIEKSFSDIPPNYWALKPVLELKEKYSIILSPPDEINFSGNKNINRYELAYGIDLVLNTVLSKNKLNRNPYEQLKEDLNNNNQSWDKKSEKNITNSKIMVGFGEKNDFSGNTEVNRYQLAVTLIKAIEYIESHNSGE